jgi:LPS export ABC transporter protein LptC
MAVTVYSKRLKQMLLLILVATAAALLMVFYGYRHMLNRISYQGLPFQNEAGITLSRIHQTATLNGKTEWCLDADAAQYANATHQASLKNPLVTFFLDNQQQITLTAKQGMLNTESKDIMITDGVTLKYNDYHLKTDTLYYSHEKRIIYSEKPVKLDNDKICIHADSMVLDLKTNQTRFQGNVETRFGKTI